MKLQLVLILGFLVQSYATVSQAQTNRLNLQFENNSLKEVIQILEDQTDYSFVYKYELVSSGSKITGNFKDKEITEILESILRDRNLTYMIKGKVVVILPTEQENAVRQQKSNVKGTVTDSSGAPLPGVTIVIKGTTQGTISDSKGNYSLADVPVNAILVFSFVGMKTQEIPITGRQDFYVEMEEETIGLEEVVAVGYGTQKKANLTGAVAQIKGEILENRSVANISQALQGQVANLNISTSASGGATGGTPTINIRGYTGLGYTAAPLIVIDGIQGGDINNINPNDVESISVLKDAASAAIYGSRAPYGVILITTKRGKSGQKPSITYNNNFGFGQIINVPKMMNSLDFVTFFNEASANSGNPPTYSDENVQRIKDYLAGKITDQTIPNPASTTGGYLTGNANNDWFDIMFKDASFSQQHNIGISGATDKSSYYIGLGYLYQDGLFQWGNDHYQRYNARINLSSNLTNWLTVGFRSAFFRGYNDVPDEYEGWLGNPMHAFARTDPNDPVVYPNGDEFSIIKGFKYGGRDKQTSDNLALTGEFIFHPLSGWDITVNYSYDGIYDNSLFEEKELSVTTYNGPSVVGKPNYVSRYMGRSQHYTLNMFSTYEKQLGKHYFKVTGGFTQELYDNVSMSGKNNYLYSQDLPSLSLTYGSTPSLSDGASQLAIRGGFGRINYNYKEKYLFEFNGRYDGTSKFLSDVRYKFYPGMSAAWMPSKEVFWRSVEPFVNSLKIRATYGSLGDQDFAGNYPFYPSLSIASPTSSNWLFNGGRESSVSQPALISSSLSWITTTTLDFGADLTSLSNRLNVSFDWYRRYMDDYVGPAESLPAFLGTSAPQTNSAAMETKGFELTVGWRDRIKDFKYAINAVLSDYRSYVTKYPNPNKLNSTWYEGMEIGEIWGYETVGLFQSDEEIASAPSQSILYKRWLPGDVRYKDLNKDEKIDWGNNTVDNPGDKKVIGNTTPRYSFGLNMSAEYKGFDLTLFLQGVGKRDVAAEINAFSNFFWGITGNISHSSGFVQQLDRWSESNPDGYYPKYYATTEMYKNMQKQTRYLQSAAYLRVKNIQLGYSLPPYLLNKIGSKKIRLFVNVENLATLTKLIKTMDPEFSNFKGFSAANTNFDGKIYPLQRTWACGLNVTF
ncbi:MAG: SusC/RagA family TonB-linked outer membrane protein [Prolixibacteraceae bacterium]